MVKNTFNWKVIIGLFSIVIVGLSAGIMLQSAQGSETVQTTISDLKTNSHKYETSLVIVEGTVINWTEKTFYVTITSEDGFYLEKNFTRKYLIIQDLNTSDLLVVRPVKDISMDFISEGEVISVTGYLKNSLYNKDNLNQEYEIDGMFFVFSITNSSGETLEIDVKPVRQRFDAMRTHIKENIQTFEVKVIEWKSIDFNITVTSDDGFYKSHIVTRNLLIVEDLDTQETYFVITQFKRCNDKGLPSDFISVGEEITIEGANLDLNMTQLAERPLASIIGDVDGVIFGISLENSSGDVYQFIKSDKRNHRRK